MKLKTIQNPSTYSDEDGNRIECTQAMGSAVTVIFRGRNNRLVIKGRPRRKPLKIIFECDNAECVIGENRFRGKIRLGEGCSVSIGQKVTCTGPSYVSTAEGASVKIGDDCMFASRNEIRANDGHPIFSVLTGERVNTSRSIEIGDHVWLGAGAAVLGGSKIGSGSVVGYASVVKGVVPNNCVVAGIPARIVKRDCAWERPHLNLHKPALKPNAKAVKKSIYWNVTDDGG